MPRWKLTVEYDGRPFLGWQRQPQGETVQSVLEAALERLFPEAPQASSSGRTDAGVHALGQVVSFRSAQDRSTTEIVRALNAALPEAISVVSAERVPEGFDPRRWARRKRYRYTWLVRDARSPLRGARHWHVRRPLDVEAMREAAERLVGRHDFTSFRASGCTAAHPVRVVDAATVASQGDEVWLDIWGTGFLRHMVRIVAGTLTEVGLGRREPGWVAEVLASRDRTRAGRTAPAQGLTLMEVEYGEGPPEWIRGGPESEATGGEA